jgi:uncharacterized damage-inducible protein DinB
VTIAGMPTRAQQAVATLDFAHRMLKGNVASLSIDDALQPAGGFRSPIGILKHVAGWSAVYYSYAFEEEPRHWRQAAWPRGLRDTIEPAQSYLDELIVWLEATFERWTATVGALDDAAFDAPHRAHFGGTLPLSQVLRLVFTHWCYHAGEINAVLSILRGEAWEYSEEVEENHISTAGHRIRPNWMSDDQARAFEAYAAERDRAGWV